MEAVKIEIGERIFLHGRFGEIVDIDIETVLVKFDEFELPIEQWTEEVKRNAYPARVVN